MLRLFAPVALLALLAAPLTPARAAPRVATDIAPVQSLVAAVMEGLGAPGLILPPGAAPHDHSMRPSEAAALADAELVFWIGPALTPWLERSLQALAGEARLVTLSEAPGSVTWPARSGIEQTPIPGSVDPHLWLDPDNARLWLGVIAAELAGADPEHAAEYAANAARARGEIDAAEADIRKRISGLGNTPLLVTHDSWQYFTRHFALPEPRAISDSEAARPGPAYLRALQQLVAAQAIACVLAEPPVDQAQIDMVFGGSAVTIVTADPLGTGLAPGAGLYPELLRSIGRALASCGR